MENNYIAILSSSKEDAVAGFPDAGNAMNAMGMHARYASDGLTLFSTEATSILPLPDGGILIGVLFTREGTRVRDFAALRSPSSSIEIRAHILENCWGSYLIIQPDIDAANAFTITRAPTAAGGLPCFWSVANGMTFFTSDIFLAERALLYKRRVDWDFIVHRLSYGGIKTQRTGLMDLFELLPGCALRACGRQIAVTQAWSPWDFVAPEQHYQDPHDATIHIRYAVECAVRAWADTDPSILLELSGGLDSSIVAACLRESHAHVTCCNLVTPVPGVDERQYARQMATQLGAELHTAHLGFDQACFDFPVPPDSVAPAIGPLQYAVDKTMEATAERFGASAYHTGGGGDSVFCYLRTAAPSTDAWRARRIGTTITAVRDLATLHQCTFWKAGRLTLSKLRRPPSPPLQPDTTFLTRASTDILPEPHPWFAAPPDAFPGDRERIVDLAGNQIFESQAARRYKRPLRFPLLSQPVMEACLRAPSWMWIAGGRNRALARAAFSDLLPPEVANRQSKATYMSYLTAVFERNKRKIENFLLSGRLQSRGLLDASSLRAFFSKPPLPRDRTFLRTFDLCMVENWVRHQP